MLTKTLSVVLLTCALFSGQLLAKQQDHAFVWFATGGHQLRHEADSDEAMNYGRQRKNPRKACASTTTGRNRANQKAIFVN